MNPRTVFSHSLKRNAMCFNKKYHLIHFPPQAYKGNDLGGSSAARHKRDRKNLIRLGTDLHKELSADC